MNSYVLAVLVLCNLIVSAAIYVKLTSGFIVVY